LDSTSTGPPSFLGRDWSKLKILGGVFADLALDWTTAGKYALTDGVYAQLLHHLSLRNFDFLTPEPKDDVANHYFDLKAPHM
jgi:hypothetical protein